MKVVEVKGEKAEMRREVEWTQAAVSSCLTHGVK